MKGDTINIVFVGSKGVGKTGMIRALISDEATPKEQIDNKESLLKPIFI